METEMLKKPYTDNILQNGWFESDLNKWKLQSRGIAFDDVGENKFLAANDMLRSKVSQKVKVEANHKYYLVYSAEISRYGSGTFGINVKDRAGTNLATVGIKGLTKGLEKRSAVFDTDESKIITVTAGCLDEGIFQGKLGKIALYDLTDIFGKGNEIPADQFDLLLTNNIYLESEFGIEMSMTIYLEQLIHQVLQKETPAEKQIPNEESEAVFVSLMNEKAGLLGMMQTKFKSVNDMLDEKHSSTVNDTIRLILKALSSREILQAWSARSAELSIKGKNNRIISLNNILNVDLGVYTILGGQIANIATKPSVALLVADEEYNLYLALLMNANSDEELEFEVKTLLETARHRKAYPEFMPKENLFTSTAGLVMSLKGEPVYWLNAELPVLFSFNRTKEVNSGALMKLMAAVLITEFVPNLYETFSIKTEDIASGDDPQFFEGDLLRFNDALYLMFLSDSNTVVNAVTRIIGERAIKLSGS